MARAGSSPATRTTTCASDGMEDMPDLDSGAEMHAGSSPALRTIKNKDAYSKFLKKIFGFFYFLSVL